MESLQPIIDAVSSETGLTWLRAAVILALGWLLARLAAGVITRFGEGKLVPQRLFLLRRVVLYAVLGLALGSALVELGFNLGVLLGAAGILTVALGFASQTSASNIISGLFLIGESPFSIGDIIKVDTIVGEVVSIDLLSVKLRTFDNLFVRVPNETLIKTNVTNFTRYPIRRYDLQISVAVDEDLDRVRSLLESVADAEPLCLDEPRPLFLFLGFTEYAQTFQFSVWTTRANWLAMREAFVPALRSALIDNDVSFPVPPRRVASDERGDAWPIRILEGAEPTS